MTITTIEHIKKLEEAGFPEQQACAQVEVITSIVTETARENVTNRDFDRMEKDLRRDLERCESRLEFKIDKLDLRVANLEKRVDGLSVTVKWGLGTVMTYMTILMTVFQLLKH